jgi:protein-S-isoprenylcysteine O-methyltransferase Ste14
MKESKSVWWQGKRGEWYVVVQAALFVLVIFGPRTLRVALLWSSPDPQPGSLVGILFLLTGLLFAATGVFNLGNNLTPLPCPKEDATLVRTGAYRFVRHPIYSGIIFMAFGWSLWVHGWLTFGYALLLFVFLDIKSRREELWLKEKFPEYSAYQKRVRKLIPFVY